MKDEEEGTKIEKEDKPNNMLESNKIAEIRGTQPIEGAVKILDQRKNKIINWFKDPYNATLTIILVLAFIIRFTIFLKTLNQPLWWDEAEYASGALHWVLGTPSGLAPIREVVVPILWGMLYKIYPRELLWRFLQVIISTFLVFATYFCGKELFDKKIGLISAIFIASNALILFYTGRLLTYIWAPLFIALIIGFFYKGYIKKQGTKYIYYSMFLLSLGVMIYWTIFLSIPIIFISLIIIEKFKFIKSSKLWKASFVGIIPLLIYFILSYIKIGAIHPRMIQIGAATSSKTPILLSRTFSYLSQFPQYFGWYWVIFFIIGTLSILELVLILDIILKGNVNKIQKAKIFVIVWFLIILAFFSILYVFSKSAIWETFLFPLFPAVGIISALGVIRITNLFKKYFNKKIVVFLLIIIILIASGFQLSKGFLIIENGLHSFSEIRSAGEWLKQNSDTSDIILSSSRPQVTYSAQRKVIGFPKNESDFLNVLIDSNVKYLVLSGFDSPPQWAFNYPQSHQDILIPMYAVPSVLQPDQTMVVIYEINLTETTGENEDTINNLSVQ